MNNPMDNLVSALAAATDGDDHGVVVPPPAKKARTGRSKKGDMPREKRLEQNRKAAIESRRRKKEMVSCACLATRRGTVPPPTRSLVALCSAVCLRSLLLPNTCMSLSCLRLHSTHTRYV